MLILKIILLVFCSYFVGNINFAIIISRFRGTDIRKLGSGNPGANNMLRNYGTKLAFLTLFLDALKGFVPSLAGYFLLGDSLGVYIAGFSVVIGHMYPVAMRFKGGKGVATSVGVFLCSEIWWITLIVFAVALLYAMFFHYGFVSSMILQYSMLLCETFLGKKSQIFGFPVSEIVRILLLCAIVGLVTYAHRRNFVRLFTGKESKVYVFGIGKPAPEQSSPQLETEPFAGAEAQPETDAE